MVTITATYGKNTFIRKGQEKMRTIHLAETTYPGFVFNVADASAYDFGDTDLGIAINDMNWSTATGSLIAVGKIWYVPMNDCDGVEVLMTEANVGTIGAGALVRVTTAGKIITWTYTDAARGTDTMADVIGTACAAFSQAGTGWVKLGKH